MKKKNGCQGRNTDDFFLSQVFGYWKNGLQTLFLTNAWKFIVYRLLSMIHVKLRHTPKGSIFKNAKRFNLVDRVLELLREALNSG
jgi:hypothetical protein